MRITKRFIISSVIAILLAIFLSFYQLPYYIYKPGEADELNPIVEVDGAYSSKGDMHLVTVRGGQATPIQFLLATILPHQDVMPIKQVIPKGLTDEEYFHAQLQMMESSQEASIMVAYQEAGKKVDIEYDGIYVVSVLEGMPADGLLEPADRIIQVDETPVNEADDLIRYMKQKEVGDSIRLQVIREDKTLTRDIVLEQLPDKEKIGIGITLVTDRHVNVQPEVHFSSGNIGGPSAGLMFALEIYDQLTARDLTNGLQIAGTGEIDYEGNVHRIGGIDKKIVAADRKGCDVFFAANENGKKGSNYELAKQKATEIETDMKVIPVDTFKEAVQYLQNAE